MAYTELEAKLIVRLTKKLGREPTVGELDQALRPFMPKPASSLPYVCHCGRPDCSIDFEDE